MGKPSLICEAAAAAAIAGFGAGAIAAPQRESPERAVVIAAVKAELKDPDSAKFEGVKETSPGYWCGRVNAKNSYGGYTGFSVFFYHEGKAALSPPELDDPKLCS